MPVNGVGRLSLLIAGIAMVCVTVILLVWIAFESELGGSATPAIIFGMVGSGFAAIALFGLWYRSGRDKWPK